MATVLHVLARPDDVARLRRLVLAETGSLGIRQTVTSRTVLPRHERTVHVDGVPVRIKHGPYGAKPEHDDLAAAAAELGLPLRTVAERALRQPSPFVEDGEGGEDGEDEKESR
ncbi:nickel insertion protein [Kitasatospora gansuensis]